LEAAKPELAFSMPSCCHLELPTRACRKRKKEEKKRKKKKREKTLTLNLIVWRRGGCQQVGEEILRNGHTHMDF